MKKIKQWVTTLPLRLTYGVLWFLFAMPILFWTVLLLANSDNLNPTIVRVLIVIATIVLLLLSFMQLWLLRRFTHRERHDSLTNLRNRHALFEDIKQLDAENFSVVYIDIYHFKTINDVYGYDVGDQVLLDFANRLRMNTPSPYLYRLGGDEFLLLIEGIDQTNRMLQMLPDIRNQLIKPYLFNPDDRLHYNISMGVGCVNIGIESFPDKIRFVEDLRYDSANYKLRPMICDTIQVTNRRLKLERSILTAISHNDIEVFFHPLHYKDGTLKGFEALARWNLDDEIIPPGAFIPLINSHGLGYELDLKVIELIGVAYPQLKAAKVGVTPCVSINISMDTISRLQTDRFLASLQATNIPKEDIILEILEDVVIEPQSLIKLRKLKKAGYQIALDDFTTGATSFDYLTLDEFSIVKIDQLVIQQIHSDSKRSEITKDLVQMIHKSNKMVVIEGIETKDDIRIAHSLGVDVIQGYYYAKPMPLKQTIEYIKKLKD